jgi:hypothetical protein
VSRIGTLIVLAALMCAVFAGSSRVGTSLGAALAPLGQPFAGVYGKRW